MTSLYTLDELLGLRGQTVYDTNAKAIGTVEDIYYDDASREPEWIGVSSGRIFKSHHVVPVATASAFQDSIQVPYEKAMIDESPEVDGEHIDAGQEHQLYQFYHLDGDGRTAFMEPIGSGGGIEATLPGDGRLHRWHDTEGPVIDATGSYLEAGAEPMDRPPSLDEDRARRDRRDERFDEPISAGLRQEQFDLDDPDGRDFDESRPRSPFSNESWFDERIAEKPDFGEDRRNP
jgi:hypothetical protein